MSFKTKRFIKPLLFTAIGCLTGYIYYRYVGCYGT